MAQSNVYSLNVVGYINLTIPAGYSLVTAQLQGADNSFSSVLGTNLAGGGQFTAVKWNPATQSLDGQAPSFYTVADGAPVAGWYDVSQTVQTTKTLSLGEAFFILNAGTSATLTLVGQVSQATNTITLVPGYSFVGSPVPVVSDLSTNSTLQLPQNESLSLSYFSVAAGTYGDTYSYYTAADSGTPNGGWFDTTVFTGTPAPIVPAVGQGFLVLNSGTSTTWKPSFTVQ